MKKAKGGKKRFWLISLFVVIGLALLWLGKISYDHKGFFVYHYDILVSEEHASYQDELLALVKRDPVQAFRRFREILAIDPVSYNACHGIAHQMGHKAFEAFGFQRAMQTQDALCGGGYIHGIIEGRFGILQEREILSELTTICDEGNNPCFHGIGHGLMIATKLDIDVSLTYCDSFSGLGRRNCYDGVWMHIFDLEESGGHSHGDFSLIPDAQTVDHFALLCADTNEQYKVSCYFYLPRIYAHHEEVAFDEYRDLCESVEDEYQITCAAGSGHSVMKYNISDPNIALSRCDIYSTDALAGACKEGGSIYYLFAAESATCDTLTSTEDRRICKKADGYRGGL